MSFLRKPRPGRRRPNLQIDYPFDRAAYVRFRLRRGVEGGLRRGEALLHRVVRPFLAATGAVQRQVRRGRAAVGAARPGEATWLPRGAMTLTPEAPAE